MTLPQQLSKLINYVKEKFGAGHAAAIEAEARKQGGTQKQIEHIARRIGEPVPQAPKRAARPGHAATQTASGDAEQLRAELITAKTGLQNASRRIAELEHELKAATDATETAVSMQALQIAQAQGNVPPVAFHVPKIVTGTGNSDILQELDSITNPTARAQFIRANRERINRAYEAERISAQG